MSKENTSKRLIDFSPKWTPMMGGVLWASEPGFFIESHLPNFIAIQIGRLRIHIPGKSGLRKIVFDYRLLLGKEIK